MVTSSVKSGKKDPVLVACCTTMDLKNPKGYTELLRTSIPQHCLKVAYNSPPKKKQTTKKKAGSDKQQSNNEKSERQNSLKMNSSEQFMHKLRKEGIFKTSVGIKKLLLSNEKTHKKGQQTKQRVMSDECLRFKQPVSNICMQSEELKPRSTHKRTIVTKNTNPLQRTNSKDDNLVKSRQTVTNKTRKSTKKKTEIKPISKLSLLMNPNKKAQKTTTSTAAQNISESKNFIKFSKSSNNFPSVRKKNRSKRKVEHRKRCQIEINKKEAELKHCLELSQLKCSEHIGAKKNNSCSDIRTEKDSKNQSLVKLAIRSSSKIQSIFRLQTEVNARMRAVLIDWLMRITAEMLMQRQSVYLAINYVDYYIQVVHIEKREYQLAALAGLLIAFKQEQSHHEQFIQILVACSDNGYSRDQIHQMERKIAFALKFKLNPTTHNFWIEYFTLRWDRFLQKGEYLQLADISQCKRFRQKPILFRQPCRSSYNIYRQLIQLVDAAVHLQTTVSHYDRPKIVIAAIYLVLRVELEFQIKFQKLLVDSNINKFKEMYEDFQRKTSPIFRDRLGINQIFNQYLVELCDFELGDIIPEIKYLSGFLDMTFVYDVPENLQTSEQVSYEQFIRYQIHSAYSLQYVLRMIKEP